LSYERRGYAHFGRAGAKPARPFDPAMTVNDPIITLNHLRFRWLGNGPDILDIEAMTVSRGERVFIEGASGSGKSTLLCLLAGVMTPQHGEIYVLGQRIDRLGGARRDRFRADHIGFIFQLFNLIPYLSVLENVTLPCRFSRTRRTAALANGSDLDAEAVRLLNHLDLDAGLLARPVTDLSVGQQQRVAAARALIGRPEILIADEPTSSLDTNRRTAFLDLLFRECEAAGTTLVFVSHDAKLEPLFDRTLGLTDINRAAAPASEVR
jgi:putative ABC transport system ATP-binding protein